MARLLAMSNFKRAMLAGTSAAAVAWLAGWVYEHRRPGKHFTSLSRLRRAIVGSGRTSIVRVFGPPRSFSRRGALRSQWGSGFWQSDVWYYPLNGKRKIAMAIHFQRDRAASVDFFESPIPETAKAR